MDLNKVILIGRFTADPELSYTQSGDALAKFSIAVNGYKDQVNFFNCIAWRKTGEIISEYCKKGHRIGIEGKLQQDRWQDKDGNNKSVIKINVDSFQFLQPKTEGSEAVVEKPVENNPFDDSDIPF